MAIVSHTHRPWPDTAGASPRSAARQSHDLPRVSKMLARGFGWYVPRYLRRHFDAVRLARGSVPELDRDRAVVFYLNHPSWWDPLVAALLHVQLFGERTAYAPIDQQALKRYPLFRKLGFYGVDLQSRAGARDFLHITRTLIERSDTALWITPGGRFADVRTRTCLQPGLAHLAAKVSNLTLVPLAIEYTFWEERTPEALVEFGSPVCCAARSGGKRDWQAELEERLAAAQASLAAKAMARDAGRFEVLLEGTAGVGGCYDVARRIRLLLTGKNVDLRHGGRRGAESDA